MPSNLSALLEPELYEYLVNQAKKNRRTLKGELNVLLEIGKEAHQRTLKMRRFDESTHAAKDVPIHQT